MASEKLVTIICPSYGHERFIQAALESFASQSHSNLEILVVDDCSPDDSNKIIESIRDSRLRLLKNRYNAGVSNTLNRALAEASGEVVCICASDDRMNPDHVERVLDAFDDGSGIGAVYAKLEYVDENDRSIGYASPSEGGRFSLLRDLFFDGNMNLAAPGSSFKRDVFERIGTFKPALIQTQDYDFNVRVLLNFDLKILAEPTIKYRRMSDGSNLSGRGRWIRECYRREFEAVIDNFLSIDSIDLYRNIFGLDQGASMPCDVEDIPFMLAKAAVESENGELVDWGFCKFRQILGTVENWDSLFDKYHISFQDLVGIYRKKYSIDTKKKPSFKELTKKAIKKIGSSRLRVGKYS